MFKAKKMTNEGRSSHASQVDDYRLFKADARPQRVRCRSKQSEEKEEEEEKWE